ncbi:MAG: hypothetical protein ABID63_11875 [Pseudomonadota bacterium]
MTKVKMTETDSFRQRHHDAAFAVLERFAAGLKEKADAGNGTVSADKIDQMLAVLRHQPALFDDAWHAIETEMGAVQSRQHAAIRHDPFGRLLVSRFAHLLEGREAGDLEHGALSRDILQPLFQVIRMMVGMDTIEKIDAEIRGIIDAHADAEDEMRDPTDYWDHLAEEQHVADRINMLFARMALHFADYDKRKQWFIQLINDNLNRNHVTWHFTEAHFVRLIRALFRDVRAMLTNTERAAVLAAKFGHDDMEKLRGVMAAVDRDIAALHNSEAAHWQEKPAP